MVAARQPATTCPRCDGRLTPDDQDDPSCLDCGYVDYQQDKPIKKSGGVWSGTGYRLRYIGDWPALAEMIVTVNLVKREYGIWSGSVTRASVIPDCPWCGDAMSPQDAGKFRSKAESRYACPTGHRITLKRERETDGWL